MYLTKIQEISFNNKYTNWYLSICKRAQQRASDRKTAVALLTYTEGHHILPKSFKLGGEKDLTNFAYLTLREHFICHHLLTKMFSGKQRAKMNYAMTCFHRKSSTRVLNSRQYAIAVSFYKEKFDGDRCAAISKGRALTPKILCPHCNKTIDPGNYKLYHGDLCKKNPNIDQSILLARSASKKAGTLKSISAGTHQHRPATSYGILTCPHCQASGDNMPTMKRWHFDRCKLRQLSQ